MLKQLTVISSVLGFGIALSQGGQGGGAGQGGRQAEYERRLQEIDNEIGVYLNGEEIKSILTPGEHVEWKLDLKVGQVIIAEARSDAFDPALEIVDGKDKVLASNDDRFPGDQRPLLLWECEKDGTYLLRGRSFLNKAGGQFFTRFAQYDTMPLETGQMEERGYDKPTGFLLLFKVPMKAGQIKRIMVERPSPNHFGATMRQVISPIGLPDIDLASPLHPIAGDPAGHARGPNVLMAPIAGTYYVLADLWGADKGRLRASAAELTTSKLKTDKSSEEVSTDTPSVWSLEMKAGEFIQLSTPKLHLNSKLIVTEAPDVAKYSLEKPETNPFFPKLKGTEPEPGPAFVELPARSRDPRTVLILARRNTSVLVASNGTGPDKTSYSLTSGPAAKVYGEAAQLSSNLQVGNTDYWGFEAKVGDVMSLSSGARSFSEHFTLLDPDLVPVWSVLAEPDQTTLGGLLVVTKPGRYLATVASMGHGGGGDYSMSRTVYRAKEFDKSKPARGEIGVGEVQVWKFTAQANDPLLIRWKSSNWGYRIAIYQENGVRADFPMTHVDPTSRYGILNVNKLTNYLIVLTGDSVKVQYSIEVSDLPGT